MVAWLFAFLGMGHVGSCFENKAPFVGIRNAGRLAVCTLLAAAARAQGSCGTGM